MAAGRALADKNASHSQRYASINSGEAHFSFSSGASFLDLSFGVKYTINAERPRKTVVYWLFFLSTNLSDLNLFQRLEHLFNCAPLPTF